MDQEVEFEGEVVDERMGDGEVAVLAATWWSATARRTPRTERAGDHAVRSTSIGTAGPEIPTARRPVKRRLGLPGGAAAVLAVGHASRRAYGEVGRSEA
jgi:hypothetical protein